MTATLLIIGLDGADGQVLDRWTASGALPSLAALRRRGRFSRMRNRYDISDDALWASFQYGADVGVHGRYHYLTPMRSGAIGMGVQEEDAADVFWSKLSAQGYTVGVFDIPKCPAPKPLNGIHLADWLVHGRYADAPQSYPAALAQEVVDRFGPAPASRCGYRHPPRGDNAILDAAGAFQGSIEQKRTAGLHYLGQRHWDLFLIGFKEAHCAGHGLWQLADARHADFNAAETARLGDPVLRVYEALDRAVGDLVKAAGTDAEVIVVSTTDMEPNGSVIHLADGIGQRLNAALARRYGGLRRRVLQSYLPRRARRDDFCKVVPSNENFVAFHICRRDRTRLTPLLDDAEAMLRELVDPASGEAAFTAFARPSSEWSGKRAARLPDLLAICRPNHFPRSLESPRLGRIEGEYVPLRPGNHVAGGALLAAGPLVQRHEVTSMAGFAALAERVLSDTPGAGTKPHLADAG